VPKNKEVVIALREIAAGTVTMENIRELEELRVLPEAGARERELVDRMELKEVLDEATTTFDETSKAPSRSWTRTNCSARTNSRS
jgi:hypothetical protein